MIETPDQIDAPDSGTGPASAPPTDPTAEAAAARPSIDLAAIERDLEGVETALRRLDDGSYWTDEVSGEPIPDELLAADPVTRRAP